MSLPEPTKRGQVHPKDYQNEEFHTKLQPLVTALNEEIPDAKYDAKQLAIMLVQILHFQEAALGKDAMPPRICPKLPIRLITDGSVNGALHAIAVKVHEIKRARALKAIEWQNPGKRKECLEILVSLRRDLERRHLLKVPLVYISPSLGNETQRLREYVRRLQGSLAESPDESGVTHMVFPFGPEGDPDDGKEYSTVIAVKGNQVRVHYWYQPDSYDEWIPAKSVDSKEVVADKAPPGGRWKVTPRWVVDSEKYNEWMNPADYTTPDFEAEMEAAEARGGKEGKRVGGSLTGTSKKARTDAGPEVAADPLSRLDVHVVTRKVLTPHKSATDTQKTSVENLSQGQVNTHLAAYLPPQPPQLQHRQTTPPPTQQTAATASAASDAPVTANGSAPPPAPRTVRQSYSAPVSASWFRYDSIHEMERTGAPDFFNGRSTTKTPRMYRTYRDIMITRYLQLPAGEHLTFSQVREEIPDAEVTGLQRIFDLLLKWGIINHDPSSSLASGRLQAAQRMNSVAGRHKLSTGLPPGTACMFDFKRPSRLESTAAAQQGGIFQAGQSSQRAPGSLLTPAFGRPCGDAGLQPSVLTPVYCSAMPWVECTRLRYHCTKHPDINLCPEAYAEGRFPPGCSSRDFIRIDTTSRHASSDGWRPEETLLLLEGIELYKEDWAAVAAHVGTRSQAACLMHFVRLPIEDAFIEDMAGWGPAAAAGGSSEKQQQHTVLPFQDDNNPVMSTVGFLAVLMGPKVAAAAAQRALQVVAEGDVDAMKDLTHVAHRIAQGPQTSAVSDGADGAAADGDIAAAAAASKAEDGDVTMQDQQQQANGDGPNSSSAPNIDPNQPVTKQLMLSAAAASLAAAAVRCQLLAEQEEREIQRLMVMIADLQQKKVDAKTKLFVDITQVVEKERQAAEASLKQLQSEHTTVVEQRKKAAAAKEAQQQQQRQKALAAEAVAKKQKQQQQQQQQQQQKEQPTAAATPAQAQQQQQQTGAGQQGAKPILPAAAVPGSVAASGQPLQQQAAAPAPLAAAAAAVTGSLPPLQQQQIKVDDAMDEDDFDMP